MRFRPDLELYPFTSRWLPLADGARFHYLDEGSGPVLLLLHGNPSWSFLYRNIIPRLSQRFRCVAPDLPGFGLSKARSGYGFTAREQSEAIIAFIDALDLRGVGVMMQDWGGPFDRRGPRVFCALMGGWLGRSGAYALNGVVRFFFTAGVVKPLPPEVWRMYLAPFRARTARRPTYVFPNQLTAADPFLREIERGLPKLVDKPALILWGDHDFAFKEHERARFRRVFPDHRDVTLREAGHFIQEDAPETICAAIHSWYAERPAAALPSTSH